MVSSLFPDVVEGLVVPDRERRVWVSSVLKSPKVFANREFLLSKVPNANGSVREAMGVFGHLVKSLYDRFCVQAGGYDYVSPVQLRTLIFFIVDNDWLPSERLVVKYKGLFDTGMFVDYMERFGWFDEATVDGAVDDLEDTGVDDAGLAEVLASVDWGDF